MVALSRRQEVELQVTELKMLRFSQGATRRVRIRNEYIRGKVQHGEAEMIWASVDEE